MTLDATPPTTTPVPTAPVEPALAPAPTRREDGYAEVRVAYHGDPLSRCVALARTHAAPAMLYESARHWSFGSGAAAEVLLWPGEVRVRVGDRWDRVPAGDEPLQTVSTVLESLPIPGWRAYGWAGFELGALLLGLPDRDPDITDDDPLLHLVVPEREVRLESDGTAILRARRPADLDELRELVTGPTAPPPGPPEPYTRIERTDDAYLAAVADAVAEIHASTLQKVILSRTVAVDTEIDIVGTYEAGRRANTPARSYLLALGDLSAAGFSPETVVEVEPDGTVSTQPLAGTRARVGERETDGDLREELVTDEKEIVEHAISVQTAQDELRTFCAEDSVRVEDFMSVLERGPVQHLASRVRGTLAPGRNRWHALAGLFPAVTASGVPKSVACAFIRRTEPGPRGLYAGAVITADADGHLDAALALRSVFCRGGRTWLRAGAGIVRDSRPERELDETREKLRTVSRHLVPSRRGAQER